MKKAYIEFTVGLFVLAGLACIIYLAVHLGELEWFGRGYQVVADFDNVSGLKVGAAVEVAGVDIGRVEGIEVGQDNLARLTISIRKNITIHQDAIASIRTKGIIGDKYVKLSLGGAEDPLAPGGRIRNTESAIEWEELISKYIQGKV